MKLFCRHSWEVKDKIEMPSAFEQMQAAGTVLQRAKHVGAEMFQRKIILILRCPVCGKTRVHTEINP